MSAKVVVWEWLHNSGEWQPYNPDVSNYIESAHDAWSLRSSFGLNPTTVQLKTVNASLADYYVDFANSLQINSTNGATRPVRRQLYDATTSVGTGVAWQWQGDDHTEWNSYSVEVANLLEKGFQSNARTVNLDRFPFNLPYIVQIPAMKQIKKGTQFRRDVRRFVLPQPYRQLSQHSSSNLITGGIFSPNQQSFNLSNTSSSSQILSGAIFQSTSQVSFPFSPASSSFQTNSNFAFSSSPGSAVASTTGFSRSQQKPGALYGGAAQNGSVPMSVDSTNSVKTSGGSSSPTFTIGRGTSTSGSKKRVRILKRNLTPGCSQEVHTSNSQTSDMQVASSPVSSIGIWNSWRGSQSSPSVQTNQPSAFGTGPAVVWNAGTATDSTTSGSFLGQVYSYASSAVSSAYNSAYNASAEWLSSSFQRLSVKRKRDDDDGSASQAVGGTDSQMVAGPSTSTVSSPSTSFSGDSKVAAVSMVVKSPAPRQQNINTKRFKRPSSSTCYVEQENVADITAKELLENYAKVVPKPSSQEDCCICCDSLTEPSGYGGLDEHLVIQLEKCSHMYHWDCISAMYNSGRKDGCIQCPTCKQIYGVKRGDCPNGRMSYRLLPKKLSGYETSDGTIEIVYDIRGGSQDGKVYQARGFPRYGYLPNNDQGNKVLQLLAEAWKRRLTFTIGTSVTTGASDVVVWNEIHHKTSMTNDHGHGYPDPNYLDNVLAELASQGVVED